MHMGTCVLLVQRDNRPFQEKAVFTNRRRSMARSNSRHSELAHMHMHTHTHSWPTMNTAPCYLATAPVCSFTLPEEMTSIRPVETMASRVNSDTLCAK